MVGALTHLGAQRPVARLPGGGPAFFIRKQGERIAGLRPAPGFQGRSLLARSIFWVGRRSEVIEGFIATYVHALIWRLSFGKIFLAGFFAALSLRPPTPASQPAQPGGGPLPTVDTGPQASETIRMKTYRVFPSRAGSPEGRNSPLWCSFLHFSQEKWRPPAGTPPGRCAPRWVKAPTARRVRTAGGLAPRPHAAGLPCAKADGTTCPPPPQKDKDRLSPVFVSPLGNWKQEKDMVSSPRRGRAVAGKRRPSPGPSGPGRGAPGGGGRSP